MAISSLPIVANTSGLEGPALPEGHAFVTEMFSGIQGEGPFVGVRQIFVRFGGCDLRCWWCDTPRSLVRRDPNKVERTPGKRDFELVANPMTIEEVGSLMMALRPASHHSVSFTGGEPLLQPVALQELARQTHASGSQVFLETHGGRVEELEQVIEDVDIVSMDLKLLSSTGEDVPLTRHEAFLSVAKRRSVYAKVVITPETEDSELFQAIAMVARVAPDIPLILQPVTPMGRIKESPSVQKMLDLHEDALKIHRDVRVIPQVHALMGQL
jgi:7-carboxy-7-deazaguanine synthase